MIRDFTKADYSAVVELWQRVGSDPVEQEELFATLERKGNSLIIDVDGQQVYGAVLATFDGRRGWLHRLAIDPARRRRGLASRLVAEAEVKLARAGALRINLLVMPDNRDGAAFWRERGYETRPDILCTKATQAGGNASERGTSKD